MNEALTVTNERVDDIPVLLAEMGRMGLSTLIDQHFSPHGNWQGLSPGNTIMGWLAHILSQGDHRLNRVQEWTSKRLETLSLSLGQPIRELDFTDDRLARLLEGLGQDERWGRFEAALNQQLLRVYDLRPERVRVDSTTSSGYWQVSEEGLFQYGYSKDHSASQQPHLKVMLSVLDPLALPVVTQVVAGNRSDDPLYIPAIQQVRESLGMRGLLYIGDSKMPARITRAFIQAGGDYYLGPLSKTQLPDEQLLVYLQPVWQGQQALVPVFRSGESQPAKPIAEGFECTAPMSVEWEGQTVVWVERRLVIRSFSHLEVDQQDLQARLKRAQAALEDLTRYRRGKKHFDQLPALQKKVAELLKRFQVEGLLQVHYQDYPLARRTGYRIERAYTLQVSRDETAIQQAQARLGWRVYVSNAPAEQLGLPEAVQAYRAEYLVEHGFGRLKGKPLSLSPMYLQDDQRATGLVRLLSLGLRILTLLEFVVRRQLAAQQQTIAGLYVGNAKRTTARPTAEALLHAFKEISLTVIHIEGQIYRHITPLSDLQFQILKLLGLSVDIYTDLVSNRANPP